MQKKSLNISKFLSVAMAASRRTGELINQTARSKQLGIEFKVGDDPVTIADFKAQSCVMQTLAQVFPTLRTIGEEVEESEIPVLLNFDPLSIQPLDIEEFNIELPIEECLVFVDPLDATKSFTKGKLDNVTTLITLTHKGRPFAAVIGQPFRDGCVFNPHAYASVITVPRVFEFRMTGHTEYNLVQEFGPFEQYNSEEKE